MNINKVTYSIYKQQAPGGITWDSVCFHIRVLETVHFNVIIMFRLQESSRFLLLCKQSNLIANRTFLSSSYLCNDLWKKRLAQDTLKNISAGMHSDVLDY